MIITILSGFIFLSSCEKADTGILERELLFTMDIGKMEDQLYVHQMHGVNALSKTRIKMEDGFFLISNGEISKVMKFNSFGDLISLYYNSSENTEPVILSSEKKADTNITRAAFQYPLNDPGEIAQTSAGELLIDDQISERRWEYDEDLNVSLNRIILKFGKNGELQSYLGQEGLGGTPFPYIHSLHVNERDEICVITKNPGGWKIFWYNRMGDPLFKINFSNNLLQTDAANGVPSIENIYPDTEKRILYLKVDYYIRDEAGNIEFNRSLIQAYDLDKEEYLQEIAVPRNIVRSDQPVIFQEDEHEYMYEFAGVARGPSFFLLSPYNGELYRLTVLAEDGSVKGRGLISFSEEDVFFREYCVNPDGVFTAIVCGEYEASVVWWRSDRYIEESENEYSKFFPNERN